MKRIWWFYQSKIDLYLSIGFLTLGIITIGLKANYLFALFGLLLLTLSPLFLYLFLWLWLKHISVPRIKKQQRFTKIPKNCLRCYWYYEKIDTKYLSRCQISPYNRVKCLDWQSR